MALEYTIVLANTSGVTQTIAVDFLELAITRQSNAPDLAVFAFNGNSNNVQYLIQGYFVAIYRSDVANGIPAYPEFTGYIARITRTRNDKVTYVVTALGTMALLATRTIAWKAGINRRSKWVGQPAETILKDMFNYNIGSLATTANGRLLNGNVTGMSTSASTGSGVALTLDAAYENLLQAMQKVADSSDTFFTLTQTGPTTFSFVYRYPYLGTDRRSSVTLSVDNGTLSEFIIDSDLISDFNAVIVGADGEGSARRIGIRPLTLPTGLLLREFFTDSRKSKKASQTQLNNEANAILRRQERKRVKYVANGVLQNASLRYGRDYFVGDYVYIAEGGVKVPQVINSVNIDYKNNGEENIDVEFVSL
jgi:hypothetical protein